MAVGVLACLFGLATPAFGQSIREAFGLPEFGTRVCGTPDRINGQPLGAAARGVHNLTTTPSSWIVPFPGGAGPYTKPEKTVITYSIVTTNQTYAELPMKPFNDADFIGANTIAEIRRGTESWNNTCGVVLQYDATGNGLIRIGAATPSDHGSLSGSILGYGGFGLLTFDSSATGYNTIGGVILDSTESWTAEVLRSTAAHEIGHALGLNHTDANTTTNPSLMRSVLVAGVTGPRPDDRWYAQYLQSNAFAKLEAVSPQANVVELTITRASPIQTGTDSTPTFNGSSSAPGNGTGSVTQDSVDHYVVERDDPGGGTSFFVVDSNVSAGGFGENADPEKTHAENQFTFTDTTLTTAGINTYRVRAVYTSAGADNTYSDTVQVDVTSISGPVVTTVSPDNGQRGTSVNNIVISGSNFDNSGAGIDVDFGSGITMDNITFDSDTQLTVDITISAGATLGARSIVITNGSGEVGGKAGGFTVTAPAPTVTNLDLTHLAQGQSLAATITGTNFHNEGGTPAVAISGTNVSASNIAYVNATTLTATLSAGGGAGFGMRNVTVTNPDGKDGTGNNLLNIHAMPIADIDTSSTAQLAGVNFDFDGTGSSDPDTTDVITNYAWDFGDGTQDLTNSTNVTHAYAASGVYTVTLTVTDDEGAMAVETLQVVALGGADGSDLFLSKGAFGIKWKNHAKGNAADTLALAGNVPTEGMPTSLNGVQVTLTINGNVVGTPVTLSGSGSGSSANPPGSYQFNATKGGSFSIKITKADLRTEIGLPSSTNGSGTTDVTVRLELTGGTLAADLDLLGTFRFDLKAKAESALKAKYSSKKNASLSGVFVVSKIQVKAGKTGGHVFSVSGSLAQAGGLGAFTVVDAISDDELQITLGTLTIDVPLEALSVSGDKISFNKKAATAPAEIKKFLLTGSKGAFKLTTNELDAGDTGIGAGAQDLLVRFDFNTAAGVLTFETTVGLLPSGSGFAR